MAVAAYKVILTGFSGAPGVNTLCFDSAGFNMADTEVQSTADTIRAAYQTIATYLADDVRVNIGAEVTAHNTATGAIEDVGTISPPATVIGGSNGLAVRATSVKPRFKTDQVVNGKLLRGGPFVGPVGTTALTPQGEIAAAARTAFADMWDGLMDILALRLVVWHRPSAPGASDGVLGHVQTVSVGLKPAVLRSRRD